MSDRMVNLFIHGWEIVPIWFKIIFILAVLNAIWDICMKVITHIVTFYLEKELVKEKLKFLMSKRDLIRDCMIKCGWKCISRSSFRITLKDACDYVKDHNDEDDPYYWANDFMVWNYVDERDIKK